VTSESRQDLLLLEMMLERRRISKQRRLFIHNNSILPFSSPNTLHPGARSDHKTMSVKKPQGKQQTGNPLLPADPI